MYTLLKERQEKTEFVFDIAYCDSKLKKRLSQRNLEKYLHLLAYFVLKFSKSKLFAKLYKGRSYLLQEKLIEEVWGGMTPHFFKKCLMLQLCPSFVSLPLVSPLMR